MNMLSLFPAIPLLMMLGLWRELEHITVSLIGDIDFIPIGSAIGAEAVDWAVGKINHGFSPPYKYFARR